MQIFKCIFSLAGRIMLCAIFFMSAVANKIPNFDKVAEIMKAKGIPNERLMLAGAIAFLVIGSICVVLGFWARLGAFLLAVFLVLATYYFHNFWDLAADNPDRMGQMIHFQKNLALFGAMLFIIGNGAGPGSIDRGCCKKCQPPETSSTDSGSRPSS